MSARWVVVRCTSSLVQVTAGEGEVVELVHTVQVRVQPRVEAVAAMVHVRAGEPARLSCRILAGRPEPAMAWRSVLPYTIIMDSRSLAKTTIAVHNILLMAKCLCAL